ncbi:alpha/beta hydrolase [Caulobacter soli]|uniref:alpha/beta hydrolase n=1 Tax=Caulobacter soli TaxID=2708539 RepID=UPI0013E9E40E|nr:alpha/beta hydrolase [Caulobacter soli]
MADTILLIHGYGCAGDVWDPMAARLRAEGYRVVAPTIRSAVRTVDGPRAGLAGLTLADYVAEMSALAQALAKEDGKKPIVFGHSMGGLIAQKIAEAGHADRLVLFAPASPADARGKPKLSPVFTFLNMALRSKPETRAGKMWKPGFKFGVMNAVPPARHDALYATMVHDSGQVLADLAWPHKDPNRTAHVDATKVTIPVLVLAGALDRTTPLEDVRLVGRKYPAADLKIYPNNAHYLIDEPNTMSILDDVIAWFTGKPKAAPAPTAAPTPAPAPAPKPAPEPVKAAEPAPAPAPAPVAPAPTPVAKPAAPTAAPTVAPTAAKTAAAKPAPKAAPKAAKPAASKAPAKPKAKAKPAAKPAPAAKAPAAKAPAKAAPAPKTAKAAPAAKPAAKPKAEAKPAAAKAPTAKAPAKAAAKAAPAPKPVKTAPAPKPAAKPAAAKAPAKTAAPKPTAAKPAAKAAPVAKAATTKAPAKAAPAPKAAKPAAAPKPAAKPKAAPAAKAPAPAKAAKAPAAKSTAKSSPAPKK